MKTSSSGQSTLEWVSQTLACNLLWSVVKGSSWHTAVAGSWVLRGKLSAAVHSSKWPPGLRCRCIPLPADCWAFSGHKQMHFPACRLLGLHRAQADASSCLQSAGPSLPASRCTPLPAECWAFIAHNRVEAALELAAAGHWHVAAARIMQTSRLLHYLGDHILLLTR